MNRSSHLNPVFPKFISIKQLFRKINVKIFEFLLYNETYATLHTFLVIVVS